MKHILFLILFLLVNKDQNCIKRISFTTYYTGNNREILGSRILMSRKIIAENNLKIKLGITEIEIEDSTHGKKWCVLTNQVSGPANFWQYKSGVRVNICGYYVLNCGNDSSYYLITKLEVINRL